MNKKRFNVLLNTIDIGDDMDTSINNSSLVSNKNLTMTVGWDSDLYVFGINYYGLNNNEHDVDLVNLASGNYQLNVFDLEPNREYFIRVDDETCTSAFTNGQGIFNVPFAFDGNGNNLYIEPLCGSPAGEQTVELIMKVLPNTLKRGESLSIIFPSSIDAINGIIRIFDFVVS